jgi:hypothetical protein
MGFYPVNRVGVVREYNPREIVVTWHDDVTGDHEKRFSFEEHKEALEFAIRQFEQLAM